MDLDASEGFIAKKQNGESVKASLVPALVEIVRSLPLYRNKRLFGYVNRSGFKIT